MYSELQRKSEASYQKAWREHVVPFGKSQLGKAGLPYQLFRFLFVSGIYNKKGNKFSFFFWEWKTLNVFVSWITLSRYIEMGIEYEQGWNIDEEQVWRSGENTRQPPINDENWELTPYSMWVIWVSLLGIVLAPRGFSLGVAVLIPWIYKKNLFNFFSWCSKSFQLNLGAPPIHYIRAYTKLGKWQTSHFFVSTLVAFHTLFPSTLDSADRTLSVQGLHSTQLLPFVAFKFRW